jgi:ATP-dependent DNA helicase DinG
VNVSNLESVLGAAVGNIGGSERPGQTRMAQAVAEALGNEQHLLVQAGTGTGKSLGYLVPAVLHSSRVVVATATLNLQHQLIESDVPNVRSAMSTLNKMPPKVAVVKGRSNYACLRKVREVGEAQDSLFDDDIGKTGKEVIALRTWAEEQAEDQSTGDREDAPSHTDQSWRQVSVSAMECIGASRCPFGQECFAERAREDAATASVVITNHAMLTIDAIEGVPMLPEYDAVIVDEAHELVSRVTQASTDSLDPALIERVARRARTHLDDEGDADRLADAGGTLADVLTHLKPGAIAAKDGPVVDALSLVRDAARAVFSGFAKGDGQTPDPETHTAKTHVEALFKVAERMTAGSEFDVLWFSDSKLDFGLRIAPIDVAGLLSRGLFAEKTVILTSATLALGGTFDPVAHSLGLTLGGHDWLGLDVGSPFDYQHQAILYAAKHLPPPGRGEFEPERLAEIEALIAAAGGRTLGLFSSRRAAEEAAAAMRERLPEIDFLCQGDAHLSELIDTFARNESTCLFGSLSLWQGLDVPGPACSLVIIDRIPFPRPDDPVTNARQQRIAKSGGNGFMQVSAQHAALLLAQGVGRLIRSHDDKGVVAILDSRIVNARYGSFLARSLPPMHRSIDLESVCGSLSRLSPDSTAAPCTA